MKEEFFKYLDELYTSLESFPNRSATQIVVQFSELEIDLLDQYMTKNNLWHKSIHNIRLHISHNPELDKNII